MGTAKTILLVEDNPDDEELTRMAFEQSNLASYLLVARDGEQAIDVLFGEGGQARAARISLVLLDLKLPKVDGLEVLRRIRTDPRTRLMPVVVLTSSREEQDVLESYSIGANSYLRKPVDFDQFSDAVKQLGMYWLLLNEPPYPR